MARILDPSSAMLGIDALGYEAVQRELYMQALAQPHGMILVTGPTGSGKTVSLYTGLNILNKEDTNISTAEDPAEINPARVNQVNESEGRPHVRFSAARIPASGPGRDHGRRNPRPRNGGDRHQGRADRPPGAVDAAHQRCAEDAHASDRHGREALRDRHLGIADHCATPRPQALQQLQGADRDAAEALLKEGYTEEEVDQGIKIYKPVGCSSAPTARAELVCTR